jgi:hypothetical protein
MAVGKLVGRVKPPLFRVRCNCTSIMYKYNQIITLQYWALLLRNVSTPGFFFFYLVCEAIGTAATPGLLCQPRMIVKMIVEKQMECRLEGETEVLGENLPQRHFCPPQNPTWPDPGLNPGRRGGKPATNRLSYGAADVRFNKQIFTEQICSFLLLCELEQNIRVPSSWSSLGTRSTNLMCHHTFRC